MAHVRHDEGRGLRLESVVGSGRAGEKRRKETRRAEASVRGRRNKSVRPCPSLAPAWTQFPTQSCRPIFFFLPPMSAAASIPKRTARDEWMVAHGREENGEKVRERMREKKRGRGEKSDRESARERKRDDTRVMRERVSDLRNGRRIGRKRK